MDIKTSLISAAAGFDIALAPAQAEQFNTYADLLVEWNKVMNLTAITEPEEIVMKHFVDSLLLFKAYDVPENATLIDVGTGAGFPGLPVKIFRPDVRVTLLDSLQKRLNFLEAVSNATQCETKRIHARAEDAGREPALRESYDIACARAVAAMPNLCEYCLPFVKKGGVFIAMKGPGLDEELAAAERALRILGGKLESTHSFTLPDGSERKIAVIRKTKPTPPNYPRPAAKMKKQPW
ncbi:MAG: 16S rRNA (guanine(527)-N(7))-methyltransferase RsmG [Clostridia bacterium]|nr:16S rRNA (guanine(527)-N(7))-methyltransferase RsmG [Clostridia bacterium]